MSIEQSSVISPCRAKKKYSAEEKRALCVAFKESSLSKVDFCKRHGLSKSALFRWLQEHRDELGGDGNFSPIRLRQPTWQVVSTEAISVELGLPNQLRLSMRLTLGQLSSLIREVSDAAAVIR